MNFADKIENARTLIDASGRVAIVVGVLAAKLVAVIRLARRARS